MELQHSIRKPVTCEGVGLHTGVPVTMTLLPRPAGSRRGLRGRARATCAIPVLPGVAHQRALRDHDRRRRRADPDGRAPPGGGPRPRDRQSRDRAGRSGAAGDGRELGALRLAPVHGGPRRPGGRAPAGRSGSLEPIRVGDEHRWLQLLPAAEFRISYTLDHEHPAVGVQVASFVPTERVFVEELAPARTYGFLKDLELLRQQGLALGGSLDNAVVVGQERILNGTLRFQDEFVRHKILDVIGDLALVGRPRAGPRRRAQRRARAEPPPGAGAGEDGATVGGCDAAPHLAPRRGALGRRGPATPPRRRPLKGRPPDRVRPHAAAPAAEARLRARGYNALLCPGGAGRPGSWRSRWGSCFVAGAASGAPRAVPDLEPGRHEFRQQPPGDPGPAGRHARRHRRGAGDRDPGVRPLPARALAVQLLVGGSPGGGQARGAPSRLRCSYEGVPGRRAPGRGAGALRHA